MDLRSQRMENEWAIFCQMADANPECIIAKERLRDEFLLVLEGTTAPVCQDHEIVLAPEHELRFSFARFFPSVPIEAYLTRAVFHPNVHPTSGFVLVEPLLQSRHHSGGGLPSAEGSHLCPVQ